MNTTEPPDSINEPQVTTLHQVLERYTMRGLTRLRSARVINAGHAFIQNLRRGHYELSLDTNPQYRLLTVFADLARDI